MGYGYDRYGGWAPYVPVAERRRNAQKKAICWFKDSSYRCITKAKEIVAILERNRIATATFVTRKPGYIVYDDYHQIAAIPFRDTFASERLR